MATTTKAAPQERVKHPSLAAALAAFQADLPHVGKGSTNPAFKSKYADLADVVAVVLPALAKQGLAWTAVPTMKDGEFVLNYVLMHEENGEVAGTYPLPDPATQSHQQLGSAITYAKRYALSAVTGIAPDEDDDGNAASAGPAARRQPRPAAQPKPSQVSAEEWEARFNAALDLDAARTVWQEARKDNAPQDVLDKLTLLAQERAAAEAEAETPQPEPAPAEEAQA